MSNETDTSAPRTAPAAPGGYWIRKNTLVAVVVIGALVLLLLAAALGFGMGFMCGRHSERFGENSRSFQKEFGGKMYQRGFATPPDTRDPMMVPPGQPVPPQGSQAPAK